MSKLPPHWLKDAQATLLLNKFAQVEVERLTEKKRLIALWAFDERERASDLAWRDGLHDAPSSWDRRVIILNHQLVWVHHDNSNHD